MPTVGADIELRAIYGRSATELYIVGKGGNVFRGDGAQWTPLPSPTTDDLIAIWAAGPQDIYVVDASGRAWHYVNSTWTELAIGTGYRAVWGSAANDVWLAGDGGKLAHGNGSTWNTTVESGVRETLLAIDGSSATDLFAVGIGTITHYNGTTWSPIRAAHIEDLRAVAVTPTRVFVGYDSASGGTDILLRP